MSYRVERKKAAPAEIRFTCKTCGESVLRLKTRKNQMFCSTACQARGTSRPSRPPIVFDQP